MYNYDDNAEISYEGESHNVGDAMFFPCLLNIYTTKLHHRRGFSLTA